MAARRRVVGGPRELLGELVRAAHGHPGMPAVSVPQQARARETARSFPVGRRTEPAEPR